MASKEFEEPGFSMENCKRNAILISKGIPMPKVTNTGTTIAGIIYKDGVILGADTRATADYTVSDKNCNKIHYLAPNIYCCGAGTSADAEMLTRMVASNLELLRLETGRVVPVVSGKAMLKRELFRHQGNINAAFVLGGVDNRGPHIYSIFPHGSTDFLPYATMGTGSSAAMAVFELQWRQHMTEEEGKSLVRTAVAAGIFNDLGSGSNIDMCITRKGSMEMIRPYEVTNKKGKQQATYRFKKGTTAVLTIKKKPIEIVEEGVRSIGDDADTIGNV